MLANSRLKENIVTNSAAGGYHLIALKTVEQAFTCSCLDNHNSSCARKKKTCTVILLQMTSKICGITLFGVLFIYISVSRKRKFVSVLDECATTQNKS